MSDYRGHRSVLLVFYVADHGQQCTPQLCQLRDQYTQFKEQEIEILALNPGDWEQHRHFSEHHTFPFPLLYDHLTRAARKYRAAALPGFINRRTVYGVDRDGKIRLAQRGMPTMQTLLDWVTDDSSR